MTQTPRLELPGLRQELARLTREGAYSRAARILHRLKQLGDRSLGWWEHALILAAALGQDALAEQAITRLAHQPEALRKSLHLAWVKAIAENHRALGKRLARKLGQLDPNDLDFRVLNLLDTLRADSIQVSRLRQLTEKPLPLGKLSPELLRLIINALRNGDLLDDAKRMFDYLFRKHPPSDDHEREMDGTLACYLKEHERAKEITRDSTHHRLRYIHSLVCLQTVDWEPQAVSQLSPVELRDALAADADWYPDMLFAALMFPGYGDAEQQLMARQRQYDNLCAARTPPAQRPRRLRIGYLTGDLRNHPVGHLACATFEHHDKQRVEVIAFDNSRDEPSELRKRLLAAFDQVVAIRKLDDDELVQAIQEREIDVLVDLSGHTMDSRIHILGRRPAPVQMLWLGYLGQVGDRLVDYQILDAVSCPAGAEAHFSEKIIRLPVSATPGGDRCVTPRECVRANLGLDEGHLLFACFNQHGKINAETFDAWCRILHAVPGSQLWLSDKGETHRQRLSAQAEKRGIAADRILFAPPVESSEHLRRIACADLVFDTQPFPMITTAIDTLAAGVPFLTIRGKTVVGRTCASLLHTSGLGDCICEDFDDYVARMIELAGNPAKLRALRARFAQARLDSVLFDGALYARLLESAYDLAHERWRMGLAPEHISLNSPAH